MCEKRICQYCLKTLRPIGDRRKNNNSNLSDYDNRKYHKTCYSKMLNNTRSTLDDSLRQLENHKAFLCLAGFKP